MLLITDMNSRIPVILEDSRGARDPDRHQRPAAAPDVLAGRHAAGRGRARGDQRRGERLPAGLPVGTVHYSANNVPEVEPAARLDRLEVVRLFDYGLRGVVAAGGGDARASATAGALRRRWTHARDPAAAEPVAAARHGRAPQLPRRHHGARPACCSPLRSACPASRRCRRRSRWPACFSGRCSARPRCRRRWCFLLGLLADLLGYAPLGRERADPADRARSGDAVAAGHGAAGLPAWSGSPSSASRSGPRRWNGR